MEGKKYSQPFMSEALTDIAKWLGCLHQSKQIDNLSFGITSEGDSDDVER